MPFPPKPDPAKDCETCGAPLTRKRFQSGRLEDRSVFLRRRFCSIRCSSTKATLTSKDAHHWRARRHRKSACEKCGTTTNLHVHHVDRDHTNNDPSNLRTLCSSCHMKLHWQEDREKRVAAAKKAAATAAARGVSTPRQYTDGRWCSVDSPLRRLS